MSLLDHSSTASQDGTGPETDWYRRGIFYELHVRAFADSDGDGIGDFPGLINKLDYLEDLGVTAVWLLPFYPSPLRDDGYDTSDYRSIHPDYGTMRNFRRFLDEAHRRNIRVITELVINHTSDQHAWFQRARRAPKGSKYRDFYVWSDTPDRFADARIIFSDFETSNWTWDPVAGAYYWHRFYSHQPDLNFDNPAVQDAIFSVLDFWLDMGVDGLRLDAVPYLFEREGTNCENLPETHEFLRSLRSHAEAKYPGRMFLAEANQWPEDAAAYFGDGDECHMNFHFPLMPRLFMAVQSENRLPIEDILEQTPVPPAGSQWATFLRNHDELTLEMVTDEERDYLWRTYAEDPRMRINLGIRRRLAPLLGNDRRKIELLNSILFSLPGTPVIYYGDELGLGDNVYLGDRDGVRTPMQWSPDRNAGFSSASPQRLYLPPITEPGYHYENVNVEAQAANPSSLLWWMRQLIALRRRNRVLGEGGVEFLEHSNGRVLAYLRTLDDGSDQSGENTNPVLCVANLSRHAQAVELDLSDHLGAVPVELFGHSRFAPVGELPYYLTLAPHGFLWFELEHQAAHSAAHADELPQLGTNWGADNEVLTGALHRFMSDRRWYAGKSKSLRAISIVNQVGIGPVTLLQVATEYRDASQDLYSIPVTEVSGEAAASISRFRPHGVIADLSDGSGTRLLVDSMVDERSVLAIAKACRSRRTRRSDDTVLVGEPIGRHSFTGVTADDVTIMATEQSNSSAIVGSAAIIKLIRRVGPGENPDLEIGRFLTQRAQSGKAAPVLGSLSIGTERKGGNSTLVLMHGLVENEGDAWSWVRDRMDQFLEAALAVSDAPPAPDRRHPAFSDPAWASIEGLPDAIVGPLAGLKDAAELLGRRTAELHRALAGESIAAATQRDGRVADETAFTVEPFSAHYQRSLSQSLRGQAKELLLRLRTHHQNNDPTAVDEAIAAIVDEPNMLLGSFARLRGRLIPARRIRIHGDLHLGQVLWTGRDFVFIDFEGEPARALGERRIKRTPLVDLAGLVRSFDYARAASLVELEERGLLSEHDRPHAEAWAQWWSRTMTDTFVSSYFEAMDGSDLLPPDPADRADLLRLCLIEKAMYEVRYELDSRPDWARFPLEALLDLQRQE